MIVKNPIYETYEAIRKKYDGYCVFIIKCNGDTFEPIGGEVKAFNKSLADLTIEAMPIINNEPVGIFTFDTYTDFGDSGVIQVVFDEN